MRTKLICAALVALAILASQSTAAIHDKFGRFDRLVVMQGFLDAVYSDLKNVHGLILFRADEFHAVTGADNHVDIVPCHTGSGVAAGGGESRPPVLPCTGMFISGFSDFLNISVKYSNKFPIQRFYAAGNFLDGRSGVTRQDIANHPAWTRQEMTEAVIRAKPRFGPDQRDEFLRSVPVRAINEFTGCRLDTATASFWVDRLAVNPDPVRVEIQWIVSGNQKDKSRSPKGCRATFEPFEGRLLSVEAQ